MISDLQSVFSDLLDKTEWMDEDSRKEAHAKLDVMGKKIGYPDFVKNDQNLAEYYTKVCSV